MIVSKKEALYHIHHEEQLYDWKEISKATFEAHLQNALDALKEYDYAKALEEKERLNRSYGLDLE